jgi:capsular polysaccharide biosynthesis protein
MRNEAEVVERLARLGFTTIKTHEMTAREQIGTFS